MTNRLGPFAHRASTTWALFLMSEGRSQEGNPEHTRCDQTMDCLMDVTAFLH